MKIIEICRGQFLIYFIILFIVFYIIVYLFIYFSFLSTYCLAC